MVTSSTCLKTCLCSIRSPIRCARCTSPGGSISPVGSRGTQTDGLALSRIDPVIRHLRRAIVGAVEAYRAQLPSIDPKHPLLRHARDRRIRFAGSWSVRLRSGGHHSNHVHPLGWISSALYLALPERSTGDAEDAGWFTVGDTDGKLG